MGSPGQHILIQAGKATVEDWGVTESNVGLHNTWGVVEGFPAKEENEVQGTGAWVSGEGSRRLEPVEAHWISEGPCDGHQRDAGHRIPELDLLLVLLPSLSWCQPPPTHWASDTRQSLVFILQAPDSRAAW